MAVRLGVVLLPLLAGCRCSTIIPRGGDAEEQDEAIEFEAYSW